MPSIVSVATSAVDAGNEIDFTFPTPPAAGDLILGIVGLGPNTGTQDQLGALTPVPGGMPPTATPTADGWVCPYGLRTSFHTHSDVGRYATGWQLFAHVVAAGEANLYQFVAATGYVVSSAALAGVLVAVRGAEGLDALKDANNFAWGGAGLTGGTVFCGAALLFNGDPPVGSAAGYLTDFPDPRSGVPESTLTSQWSAATSSGLFVAAGEFRYDGTANHNPYIHWDADPYASGIGVVAGDTNPNALWLVAPDSPAPPPPSLGLLAEVRAGSVLRHNSRVAT